MNSYGTLAEFYDELTRDVPYPAFADYYERLFSQTDGEFHTVLDLCCGTGTISCLMAGRGYEMISADASPDMLTRAMEKSSRLKSGIAPLLICQGAASLDLYGTVDAAVSSLDSLSYVPPEDMPEVFRRLHLFIRPGGLLVFDIRTPEFLRGMDGAVSVDETDDLLCLWRGAFETEKNALVYGMDIFIRRGNVWHRELEEHVEYAHDPRWICALLRQAEFSDIAIRTDGPMGGADRVFITAKRDA